MIHMPTPHYPSPAVRKVLRTLGANIHEARVRRKLPMSVIAERAGTSRPTLSRLERGDPAVGMGIYAAVLHALGLLDDLAIVADPARDTVGRQLVAATLPKRVRIPGHKPGTGNV